MTEVAYLLVFFYCAVVGIEALRVEATNRRRYFWPAVAILVGTLFALKALDADFLADREGRRALWVAGLYGDRREIQAWIISAVLVLGFVLFVGVVYWFRDGTLLLPLATVAALCTFVVVRALSLHQVDALLYNRHYFGAIHISEFLETSLVVAVGVSAFLYRRARLVQDAGTAFGA